MALHFAVEFPFSLAALTPSELSPASSATEALSFNLRRRLTTIRKETAQTYAVTLTPSPGAQQAVNFVGVIGCNLSGAATVTLRDGAVELASEALALEAGRPAWLFFSNALSGCDEIEIEFPQVEANQRLECALIVAGQLSQPRVAPTAQDLLINPLNFERIPTGTGAGAPERGKYRTLRLSWDRLVGPQRTEIERLIAFSNEWSAVVVRDDDRQGNDAFLLGAIRGPLTLTSQKFTDLTEPTLIIEELLAL